MDNSSSPRWRHDTNDMYGKSVIYVRKRHLWCDVPEPRGTQCHRAGARPGTRLKKNVIYARDVIYAACRP